MEDSRSRCYEDGSHKFARVIGDFTRWVVQRLSIQSSCFSMSFEQTYFPELSADSLAEWGVRVCRTFLSGRKPNKALEPTADGAMFFTQEVSGLLMPQFGGGSAWSR